MPRFLIRGLLMLAALPASQCAMAQGFPQKPIRLLTFEVGGSVDFITRMIAPHLGAALGQSAYTENRFSFVAIETVAKAPPDGHTLLVAGGTLWLAALSQKTSFDPEKDFAPVSLLTRSVNVLVAHPSLPVKTARDLITLAKQRPGEINYSTEAVGSSTFLTAQLFRFMSGAPVTRIGYRGTGPSLTAVMSGEVHFTFGTPGSMAPHVKSGRLRALGVTSAEPSALFPGLPTIASTGVPGYEVIAAQGLFAPTGMPPAIIQRIHEEAARIMQRAEMRERLLLIGLESVGGPPEKLAEQMRSDIAKWSRLIKEAGIRSD